MCVTIYMLRLPVQTWYFNCDAWLDSTSALEVVLPAQLNDPRASRNTNSYRIVVRTSNIANAGTDANVYVDIRGESASSGVHARGCVCVTHDGVRAQPAWREVALCSEDATAILSRPAYHCQFTALSL